MRISDWSSDVCSSDLPLGRLFIAGAVRDLHQHLLVGRGLEGHIAARVAARNVARAGLHVAGADAPADIVAGRLAEGAERGEGLREFGDEISAVGAVPVFRYSANEDRKSTRLNSSH